MKAILLSLVLVGMVAMTGCRAGVAVDSDGHAKAADSRLVDRAEG